MPSKRLLGCLTFGPAVPLAVAFCWLSFTRPLRHETTSDMILQLAVCAVGMLHFRAGIQLMRRPPDLNVAAVLICYYVTAPCWWVAALWATSALVRACMEPR